MKKYKLIRSALFTCIASLVLTTTGCNNKVKDNLKDRCVAVVDGELKILEEEKIIGGKIAGYKDIITQERYNSNFSNFEYINIKGSLVNYLSSDQINKINGKDCFSPEFTDEDWIKLINNLNNKYRKEWNLNCTDDFYIDKEIDTFKDEYNELIPNDGLFILDTSLCDIHNQDNYELDRYYLIMENDNPINNDLRDSDRILFNCNINTFYFYFYESLTNKENYNLSLALADKGEYHWIYLREQIGKKPVYNINEFLDKEGIRDKKNKYSIEELETLMKKLNNKEIEKIAENRIYVFDATKSDIDIISFSPDKDISSLNISDYYILIYDENSRTFDTLSNCDNELTYNGLYINNNTLINSKSDFIFATDVDRSYNFMLINEFLTSVGLGEYTALEYTDLELEKINSSLNQIRVKNISKGLSK